MPKSENLEPGYSRLKDSKNIQNGLAATAGLLLVGLAGHAVNEHAGTIDAMFNGNDAPDRAIEHQAEPTDYGIGTDFEIVGDYIQAIQSVGDADPGAVTQAPDGTTETSDIIESFDGYFAPTTDMGETNGTIEPADSTSENSPPIEPIN